MTMFNTEYYSLVAGLREITLTTENKNFDAREIINEILCEVSKRDALSIELLYRYYDCENLSSAHSGRQQHNALGLLSRAEIEAELREPSNLEEPLCDVIRLYNSGDTLDGDTSIGFERSLFEAYYNMCTRSRSQFLVRWSATDRNIRNVSAAITARLKDIAVADVVVGDGDIVDQLRRSSASDFGLRGVLPYIDSLITAINDEENIVEKERKIDNIRWSEVDEASTFDYFNLNAIMAYLVKLNIVARWSLLDPAHGREMLERLMAELSAKDKIKESSNSSLKHL